MSENKNSYRFFCNKDCSYFPCHKTNDPDNFNCLFCYCPLYALGDKCGGNFVYLNSGIKDCSNCMLPHNPQGYDYIISKYYDVMLLAKQKNKDEKAQFEIVMEGEKK